LLLTRCKLLPTRCKLLPPPQQLTLSLILLLLP
jgi:hypothetical protein